MANKSNSKQKKKSNKIHNQKNVNISKTDQRKPYSKVRERLRAMGYDV